ncbi:SCO1664 family protein [Janibacter cremeus]|uniref:Putative repeat protein (TIGR03843 family) n=1 Tax=Janibacter cremeus TaxID=1285192 RepID=A0A852VWG5_9MICO|nr:putative repeat protein (TIGR03843 family) [Janibacter cremeus]
MGRDATLDDGDLVVLGRHPSASNIVTVAEIRRDDLAPVTVAYKPIAGERPLWDFPDGSLAAREVAAARIDALGGFDLVPETLLRDGPLGPGSVQRWIGRASVQAPSPVVVTAPQAVPEGNLVVLAGEDEGGAPVVLSHPDLPRLRSMAVLDAVLNNSDRKGGHILVQGDRLWGIDHGVSLHAEPKLRTVLWGWAGDALTQEDTHRLQRLAAALAEDSVESQLLALITSEELAALRHRTSELLDSGIHPQPAPGWPAIPWPPL